MRQLNILLARLHSLLRRDAIIQDIDEELRLHIELETEANIERGMSSEAARQAAHRSFGRQDYIRELAYDIRGGGMLETLWQDLQYGLRMLMKKPGSAAVAVVTLALGIGATTAIFSAVKPILLEPLPYPHADRLVAILELNGDGSRNPGTFGMYRGLAERTHSFDSMAVFKRWQTTMTGAGEPERFEGQRVSAGYFRVLGVSPALGRDFQTGDDHLHGPDVAIISDRLWRRRFAGDGAIIGRQVTLDDKLYTVIGVTPGGFENVLAPSAELWAPLQYDMSLGNAWGHHLRTVGRLRPGVRSDQATREIDALGHAVLQELRPESYGANVKFVVSSLQGEVTGAVRPALVAVLGAVALLLLIACVNVTNLLLARGAQRRGEFAVRAALGAGRARLIRQVLTESLLLALLGGAVGLIIAAFGVDVLRSLSPPELPRAGAIVVDAKVFAWAFCLTTLIGLAVGLIPALHASRGGLQVQLQQSSRRAAGGHQVLRRALVITEVALALVLLVGAGLLWRSFERLFAISPGFKEGNDRFFAQALEAVRQVPGVAGAAFTSQLPLSGDNDEFGARFEGDDPQRAYNVFRYAVSPGYFETTGIPLRRGRLLDMRDGAGALPALVISESLAKSRFPGQDPIGKRIQIGPTDRPWFTIVGVVGDVKQASLAASQTDSVYTTPAHWHFTDDTMSLVVRARGDAATLAPSIRRAVWSVDKDQPITRVATLDSLLAATAAARRFALTLFEAFGLVALVLAAVGIYGVLSGSVTERTREIGIRIALGAQLRDVFRLVLGQGLRLTLIGVAIGVAGAFAVTRLMTSLLFGVSATDPVTFIGGSLLLTIVALVACYVPARRATRVDPRIALRYE
jgi:putative ABC transport system permease protein